MQIECLLKRDGGTVVDLPPKKYHFLPLADGAHVALVDSAAHVDKLLAIPEAYRLYRGAADLAVQHTVKIDNDGKVQGGALNTAAPAVEASAVTAPPALAAPLVNLGFPDSFDIGGKVYSFANVLDMAIKSNGFNQPDWDGLSNDTKADLIDEELEKLEDAAQTSADAAPAAANPALPDDRAALVDQYIAKFGKKPHHNAGIDKIRTDLAE